MKIVKDTKMDTDGDPSYRKNTEDWKISFNFEKMDKI